jgi:hypothetical protein
MSDAAIATSSSKPAATAVASAVVQRVEQRLSPRKHYAYVIQMSWNNDEDTYALRSHLELFHFQVCRYILCVYRLLVRPCLTTAVVSFTRLLPRCSWPW